MVLEDRVVATTTHIGSQFEVRASSLPRLCARRADRRSQDFERWSLTLIERVGHGQLRTPGFVAQLRNLLLPKCNLAWADVSAFTALEVSVAEGPRSALPLSPHTTLLGRCWTCPRVGSRR